MRRSQRKCDATPAGRSGWPYSATELAAGLLDEPAEPDSGVANLREQVMFDLEVQAT